MLSVGAPPASPQARLPSSPSSPLVPLLRKAEVPTRLRGLSGSDTIRGAFTLISYLKQRGGNKIKVNGTESHVAQVFIDDEARSLA